MARRTRIPMDPKMAHGRVLEDCEAEVLGEPDRGVSGRRIGM
jgi:hypothetical protein